MSGMRSLLLTGLIAVVSLCTFPVQAELLDQMLTVQAATTSVGKGFDSTTVSVPPGQELWSARTFSAKTSQSCVAASPSVVGIANGGTGITNVDMRNAKGEVSITWSFGAGIPATRFPYSAFEFALVNTSRVSEIGVDTVAVLSTNVTPLTIGYPGVRVDRKLSPRGKSVPFKFQSVAPALLQHPSTVIRSLTLRVSSRTACDTSFAVQLARFVPLTIDKSKSKGSAKTARASTEETGNSSSQSSSSSSKSTTSNPCDEDPTVPAQLQKCEEEHNFIAAECATWECDCRPSFDKKSYFIGASTAYSSSDSEDKKGKTCTNNMCGGIPGKCNFGQCLPSQFYGYNNPSIDIEAEGIGYKLDDPQTQVSWECFDGKKHPKGAQLCSMTVAQVEEAFLASMKVGAPCQLSPGKVGVCSNTGQCIPDVTGAYFCKDQVDCTPCGQTGNICWKKECLSQQEAARKLCEATHMRGGGSGICTQCYAMFKINPDGVCGTGVLAPDARGVSMDGASCSRYQGNQMTKGQCLSGQCVFKTTSSSSSSSTSSRR